jgi:death on curing protein
MIQFEEVIAIHSRVVKEFGGADGIRDKALVEAAIGRPFQTFGGQELYPSAIEKAAAILESILNNHPFVDGNKRTGYVLMRLILLQNGFDINASQKAKYDLVICVAKGDCKIEKIKDWLNKNSKLIT